MSYAMSWPLQQGLYHLFCENALCAQHFAHRIYDAPPPLLNETDPDGIYLTFGDEDADDWSTGSDAGAVHTVTLTINAPRRGFAEAKQAAAAVSDAVLGGNLTLSRGRVVNARFVDAKTKRTANDAMRQINLRFRITLEDTV